jgi:hypothetical protein
MFIICFWTWEWLTEWVRFRVSLKPAFKLFPWAHSHLRLDWVRDICCQPYLFACAEDMGPSWCAHDKAFHRTSELRKQQRDQNRSCNAFQNFLTEVAYLHLYCTDQNRPTLVKLGRGCMRVSTSRRGSLEAILEASYHYPELLWQQQSTTRISNHPPLQIRTASYYSEETDWERDLGL